MNLHSIPQDRNSILLAWMHKTYHRHSFEIRGGFVWERYNETEIPKWVVSQSVKWWKRSMRDYP